jgi:DNA-binding PadR family transcriptional regulator
MSVPRKPHTSPQTIRVLEQLVDERRSWHYGYALSQQTGLASGTLYPILMRLSDDDWLETRWSEPEQPGRPPRHMYRLTADGAREASARIRAQSPSRIAYLSPSGATP